MEWDYIIIGSGFGGSVSALRLVEKGYKVLVLEKGRRLQAGDFPKTNWNLKRFFWLPQVGFRGLFKMTFLGHVTAWRAGRLNWRLPTSRCCACLGPPGIPP